MKPLRLRSILWKEYPFSHPTKWGQLVATPEDMIIAQTQVQKTYPGYFLRRKSTSRLAVVTAWGAA